MKIAILHRYPENEIKSTNASFPYMVEELRKENTVDVKTFKKFNRFKFKFLKSLGWLLYAPLLVCFRSYDVIYCDDSFPYYAGFVKIASPKSKVIKRMGDLHLMYYCTGWMYKFFHWLECIEWSLCDRLIPVSDAMAEYVGWSPVLDPVDMDFWKSSMQEKFIDVMFHGYLNRNKGVEILLKAAEMFPMRRFVIVGDGPAKEWLETLASSNVEFKGWLSQEEIRDLMRTTSVGIAIRSNNQGNEYVYTQPFLQYWACGVPVIVSKRKCLKDYPYHFNSMDGLIFMLSKLFNCKVSYRYPIEKHDAKLIAKQLVEMIK